MFEPDTKTYRAATTYGRLDPPIPRALKRGESQNRAVGVFSSMIRGVKGFAYLFIDVTKGRYDR